MKALIRLSESNRFDDDRVTLAHLQGVHMKDWIAVFAVALIVIVGSAAGLSGTVGFLLTFLTAWYLLTARRHGFAKAREILGIRFEPPLWTHDNWRKLTALFDDADKLIKAAAVALVTLGAALMLNRSLAFALAAIFAVLYAHDIWRGGPPLRFARVPNAGASAERPVATAQPTPAPSSSPAPARPAPRRPEKRAKLRRPPARPLQRRTGAAATVIGSKRRHHKPAKPSAWMIQTLPSRKPDMPMIALKPRKLVRPRMGQRRPLLRKPPLRLKPGMRRRPGGK